MTPVKPIVKNFDLTTQPKTAYTASHHEMTHTPVRSALQNGNAFWTEGKKISEFCISQEKPLNKVPASFKLQHDEDMRAVLLSASASRLVIKLVSKRGRKLVKTTADHISQLGKRKRSDARGSGYEEESDNEQGYRQMFNIEYKIRRKEKQEQKERDE